MKRLCSNLSLEELRVMSNSGGEIENLSPQEESERMEELQDLIINTNKQFVKVAEQ